MFIEQAEYLRILEVLPISCVDLLIVHSGKVLLLKRDNDPARGQYWFPGGRVRKLETIEAAAIRIAKSETDLACRYESVLCVTETVFQKANSMRTAVHTVNICCKIIPDRIDRLRVDALHSEYLWVSSQSDSYHSAVNHPLSLLGFGGATPVAGSRENGLRI